MSFVSLSLRCHNTQNDAPDHEAADAVYPVVPVFRHGASMRLRAPVNKHRAGDPLDYRSWRCMSARCALLGEDVAALSGQLTLNLDPPNRMAGSASS